jgi:hypothetical protein
MVPLLEITGQTCKVTFIRPTYYLAVSWKGTCDCHESADNENDEAEPKMKQRTHSRSELRLADLKCRESSKEALSAC